MWHTLALPATCLTHRQRQTRPGPGSHGAAVPAKGTCRDPGPAYWVTPSGDRTEKTEQGPRAEMVCMVRKQGPPSPASARCTGIDMWPLGTLPWLGMANRSLFPGSGTEARAGISGQWLGHLQDSWCPWGSHPVLPGQAMSEEGRRCLSREKSRQSQCGHQIKRGGTGRVAAPRSRGGSHRQLVPHHPRPIGAPRTWTTGPEAAEGQKRPPVSTAERRAHPQPTGRPSMPAKASLVGTPK